ncbi:hypothetical protein [Streptomyces microflavus]|uniref:hypothetical protein n=1 Tax=Streptomyces microflavus TaxID=1919 RepID=UPI0033308310
MWQTEEFGVAHAGRPGVLLADGSEPGPVYFDTGSSANFHRSSDWWIYTGELGALVAGAVPVPEEHAVLSLDAPLAAPRAVSRLERIVTETSRRAAYGAEADAEAGRGSDRPAPASGCRRMKPAGVCSVTPCAADGPALRRRPCTWWRSCYPVTAVGLDSIGAADRHAYRLYDRLQSWETAEDTMAPAFRHSARICGTGPGVRGRTAGRRAGAGRRCCG